MSVGFLQFTVVWVLVFEAVQECSCEEAVLLHSLKDQ